MESSTITFCTLVSATGHILLPVLTTLYQVVCLGDCFCPSVVTNEVKVLPSVELCQSTPMAFFCVKVRFSRPSSQMPSLSAAKLNTGGCSTVTFTSLSKVPGQ